MWRLYRYGYPGNYQNRIGDIPGAGHRGAFEVCPDQSIDYRWHPCGYSLFPRLFGTL